MHKQEIAQSISAQLNRGIFKNLNLIQSNSNSPGTLSFRMLRMKGGTKYREGWLKLAISDQYFTISQKWFKSLRHGHCYSGRLIGMTLNDLPDILFQLENTTCISYKIFKYDMQIGRCKPT